MDWFYMKNGKEMDIYSIKYQTPKNGNKIAFFNSTCGETKIKKILTPNPVLNVALPGLLLTYSRVSRTW